jgi:hypothetical protein
MKRDQDPMLGRDEPTEAESFVERQLAQWPGGGPERAYPMVENAVAAGGALRRSRRRRSALAVGVALVAVVGGTVTLASVHISSAGPPSGSETPALESLPLALRGSGAGVEWVVYASDRAAAAGWELCPEPEPGGSPLLGPCATDLTRTRDGWATGRLSHSWSEPVGAVASSGQVVLFFGARHAEVLTPSGATTPIQLDERAAPAHPSESLFGTLTSLGSGLGDLWAYDAQTGRAHPVPLTPGITTRYAARWDTSGRLWVEGWDAGQQVRVAWSDDGGATWTDHLVSAGNSYPGGLAVGSTGEVAAFAWAGAHENTIHSTSVVSRDHGATWQPFDRGDGPRWVSSEQYVGAAAGVAQLPNGRIFVVDSATNTLWTATGDWHHFTVVPTPVKVSAVQTSGRLVWALDANDRKLIVVSSDHGARWRTVAPG